MEKMSRLTHSVNEGLQISFANLCNTTTILV